MQHLTSRQGMLATCSFRRDHAGPYRSIDQVAAIPGGHPATWSRGNCCSRVGVPLVAATLSKTFCTCVVKRRVKKSHVINSQFADEKLLKDVVEKCESRLITHAIQVRLGAASMLCASSSILRDESAYNHRRETRRTLYGS